MPKPELFESYLRLPPEERAKVDASPRGKVFRGFAGLPVDEQRKFLAQLRAKRSPSLASRIGEVAYNWTVGPLVGAGQVLREGRTPEQAQAWERMTPEQRALAKESGTALQSPFSAPTEAVAPTMGPLLNASLLAALGARGGHEELPFGRGRGFIPAKTVPPETPTTVTAPSPEPSDPRSATRLAAQRKAFKAKTPAATPTTPSVATTPSGIPMPPSPVQRLALPPASGLPASQSATRQALVERLAKAKAERAKAPPPIAEHLDRLRAKVAPQAPPSKTPDPLIGALKSLGYKTREASQLAKEHPTGTIEERIKSVFIAEGNRLAPAETPPAAPSTPTHTTTKATEPSAPTAVESRMQEIQREAEGATGLPTGRQYGSVETEMGPQPVAIGAAKSFREQFAPLYPEFRNLPDVGPKAIAEAIRKDKDNKLFTIIKDEVTKQLEREKVSPDAVAQRPSDFEAFSQVFDELAAQEKAERLTVGTGSVHEATGLPLNADGTVTLYHGTTKGAAQQIKSSGRLTTAGEPDAYFTTDPSGGEYGDGTVIQIRVRPDRLAINDEFPSGRKDFSAALGKARYVPVEVERIITANKSELEWVPTEASRAREAQQPKLFQTQATMPPEGLQPKAQQVEHGDLLNGLVPEEPTKQVKLPLGDKAVSGGAPRAVEDIQAAAERGVASPMVQPLVHTKALKQAVQAVTDFMTEQNLRIDPNGPRINVQLMEYIADGKVRPARLLEWFERRGLDFDEVFSQAGMETASESGRILQIWSRAAQILGRSRRADSQVLGEKVQRMTDTVRIQTGSPDMIRNTITRIVGPQRLNEVDEIIATLGKLDRTDRLAINRFLSDIASKSRSSKLFELYINDMISSPVALEAKAVGDLQQKSFMLAHRKIASTIDPVVAALQRRPRERFAGEASADLYGWASMFTDGFRRGMKAYATEMLDENAVDVGRLPAIPGKLGRAIRIPGRLFNAITVMARAMAERGELAARAYRLAMSEKLTGDAFDRRVAELMEHPPASFLLAMEQSGKSATYTQPFGRLGKSFMRLREAHPSLKFLVPIVKIPVNIAKVTLEHTPLNFVRIINMARKGELVRGEVSDELAKPILGTMILGGFALAAHHGLVTGHGPLNPKEKAMKEATGWRPDSIYNPYNHTYYPLRKLGVLGNLLSISADMYEAAERGDPNMAERLALTAVMSIARVATDPPFVRGVRTFADFLSDPLRYGEYWLKSFESSFVPSIVGRAASAIDPVKRETTLLTAPVARIPFASRLLPPVRTPFGEEATYGADTAFGRFAGLIPRSSVKPDTEVETEVARLGIGLGRPSKALSLGLKGELAVGSRKVARDREEHAMFETTAGKIVKDNLKQIMSTPEYQQAKDPVKRAIVHAVVTRARLGASRHIVPKALQPLLEAPR